jgi:hypothetical protein
MGFNQEFIIHPVGQGLFYSGLINHNNQVKFRMVFDCGSKTGGAGQTEVDLYRDNDFLESKTLDLLVISHFDQDHVNHINRLLAGGIIVKRLIMPFISFTERLFLISKYFDEKNDGYSLEDDFIVNFIIDPINAISDNLDGDSEIYLLDSDPNSPIVTDKDNSIEQSQNQEEQKRYTFEFDEDSKEEVDSFVALTASSSSKIYKIKDSSKGKLMADGINKLMEFVLYKRSIGLFEDEFYGHIEDLFNDEYSIDKSLPREKRLLETIEKVKTISSATIIKKIFEKAKKLTSLTPITGIKIEDLNTTAICMLHRNLIGLFHYLGYSQKSRRRNFEIVNNFDGTEIIHIQKYISDDSSRIETRSFYNRYYYWADSHFTSPDRFIYPNVLLTSDSFLLNSEQVNEFLNHFRNYWGDFWLFQFPHHGSEKSSNSLLHSNIPVISNSFINYGIGNKDSHPSASFINDLVATGNSTKLISINQFTGLKFKLKL